MLEKLMTERKTALASVFEKLFCICLNKNGFYFSPNLFRNIDIKCFYLVAISLPKSAQWLGILLHRTRIQIKWFNFIGFPRIDAYINSSHKKLYMTRLRILLCVKYKWTSSICCERYIFKYLELKEKEKRGEGKKKVNK